MKNNLVNVRVWGDLACFTRSELKIERVSYPIITPSAARGILEAIFWEPEMFYLIDSIRVIKKGKWTRFKRNEVQSVVSLAKPTPIIAGAGDKKYVDSTPRNTLALSGIEYIITAEVHLTEKAKERNLNKYVAEIERRARKGKCFHRPSFGCREFIADFDWVEDAELTLKHRLNETGEKFWTNDFGLMLYDVFSYKKRNKGISIEAMSSFFHAKVENSIMDCNPKRVCIIEQVGGES